jgi:hypothetical protein
LNGSKRRAVTAVIGKVPPTALPENQPPCESDNDGTDRVYTAEHCHWCRSVVVDQMDPVEGNLHICYDGTYDDVISYLKKG